MTTTHLDEESLRFFERGAMTYPQPVALACGRIARSRSPESLVDSLLKSAEILTRYLATVSLASFAARDESNGPLMKSDELSGTISFGSFLSIVQLAAKYDVDHPARVYLRAGFPIKRTQEDSPDAVTNTDEALISLLELRNELGHDLASLTQARAISLLKDRKPQNWLQVAFTGVESLLGLPLFVIEQQQFTRGQLIGERLLLMGETSDPSPEDIVLVNPVQSDGDPYIAVGKRALLLAPMLLWEIASSSANYRLYVFDTVRDRSVKYKAIEVSAFESDESVATVLKRLIAGELRPAEDVALADGRSLPAEWGERRRAIEQAQEQIQGRIPWEIFSEETITWFASRIATGSGKDRPRRVIEERLLDERDHLKPDELSQLILLFGTEESVGKILGRELIDLRAVKTLGVRWDERFESHTNVIDCLKTAVDFFSRHVGVSGVSLDGLEVTSGPADYIAMREALVNLFIHQDYTDKSAAAQIEIAPNTVICFNPGRSLVGSQNLVEGGKSQARNPLIARALRLVGFAELAGSGLRQLQYMWRSEKRRPPKMESDRPANTFTLTLDWRKVPDNYDKFWKQHLGVTLTEEEATILNLSSDINGISLEEAASATGLQLDGSKKALRTLVRQALVDEQKSRFFIKDHLRELMVEEPC